MTLRQTLENHFAYIVLTVAVGAFGLGWGACEAARVTNKSDKIADLEKRVAELSQQAKDSAFAVEPYQKEVTELLSNTKRLEAECSNTRNLEADLSSTQRNLAQWQQALQSWKMANAQLQSELNVCVTNGAVVGLSRVIEGKKEDIEKELADEVHWHVESARGDEFRRRIAEYQARLVSLQDKLVCMRR